jgi:carboxymethylenebutenolidase
MQHELVDPKKAVSPELNRRAFVGLSAGGAATLTTGAAGAFAQQGFGKPHPPIVAENDPSLTIKWVKLHWLDGDIDAYTVVPKNATATTPGIVIVQHVWGVDASIRDVARRYAKEGYVVIAPALYSRWNPPNGDGVSDLNVFRPYANRFTDAQVDGDLSAGAQWIRQRAGKAVSDSSPKVGITGFCAGAGIALRQTLDTPYYNALAMFYGNVLQQADPTKGLTPASFGYLRNVKTPVVGSFGGRDQSPGILPDQIRAFQTALTTDKLPNDIKIYPEAGHAFFDDTRASYVPTAASDSWPRVLAWWNKYLKT